MRDRAGVFDQGGIRFRLSFLLYLLVFDPWDRVQRRLSFSWSAFDTTVSLMIRIPLTVRREIKDIAATRERDNNN